MYAGREGSKYAVFTNRKIGIKAYFPNVDIAPTMVNDGAGSTYLWSTILILGRVLQLETVVTILKKNINEEQIIDNAYNSFYLEL